MSDCDRPGRDRLFSVPNRHCKREHKVVVISGSPIRRVLCMTGGGDPDLEVLQLLHECRRLLEPLGSDAAPFAPSAAVPQVRIPASLAPPNQNLTET